MKYVSTAGELRASGRDSHSALDSGTLTSLLYDTLAEQGRASEYERLLGSFLMFENVAALSGGIAGGMIASRWGLAVPFELTLIPQCVAVVAALSLREPAIHRTTGEMNYWRHIAAAFHAIRKRPQLHSIVALIVVMRVTLQLADEYMQLYFVAIGIPIFFLGYLNSMGDGIEAAAGRWAWRFRRFARSGRLYAVAMGAGGLGLVLVGYWKSPIAAAFMFLPFVAYYFSQPLLLADLHRHLDASHRATSESCVNFLRMLLFIPVGLTFSIAAEKTSLNSAYLILGAAVLICALPALRRRPLPLAAGAVDS